MKVLCVLNPLSGAGLSAERWPQVAELLRGFGADFELLSDKNIPIEKQVFDRLALARPGEFNAITGIGGDGTQSAAINGLMLFKAANPGFVLPPYGFIPMGTGNDIAKSFGLNSRSDFFVDDLRRAVSTLIHGADYRLDIGIINGRYFADALTVGVDSHILRERNRQKRWLDKVPLVRYLARGLLLYSWVCWGKIFEHHPRDAEITVDGVVWYSGPIMNLIVNNTRIYGGTFDFCTDSYGNDGLLDVIRFTGHTDYVGRCLLSLRQNPRHIRKMANKLSKVSTHTQGKVIDIVLKQPESAQLDGEEIPAADRFHVEVIPRAIHIRTPAEP